MKFYYYKNQFSNKRETYVISEEKPITINACRDMIVADPDVHTTETDFAFATVALVNGVAKLRKDWDEPLSTDAHLEFRVAPPQRGRDVKETITESFSAVALVVGVVMVAFGGPAGWAWIASGAIGLAHSYHGGKMDSPDAAKPETKKTSPTYQINATNTARPGEAIPCRYGYYRATPDLAAPRWTEWEDDSDGIRRKYFHAILCLGVGDFDVDDVLIGEQPLNAIRDGQYTVYAPGVDSADSIDRENSIDVTNVEVESLAQDSASMSVTWDASSPVTEGTWATSTAYLENQIMNVSATTLGSIGTYAICLEDHTSDASSIVPDQDKWHVINDTYLLGGHTWLRGPAGSLVGSGKPGGPVSDNENTPYYRYVIYAPGAAETANQEPRAIIWRLSNVSGYDWVLIGERPAFYDSLSTLPVVGDTETITLYSLKNLDSISYGPFRIAEGTYLDLEFPNGLYTQGGGSESVRYLVFTKTDNNNLGYTLIHNAVITEEQLKPWGVTISPSDPTVTPDTSEDGSRRSYIVVRLDPEQDHNTAVDRMLWTGLRYVNTTPGANADTTRIKVKFAAQSDTQQTADKIKVLATRKLPTYDGSTWSAATSTREAIWAICDLLRNSTYGVGLADTEFDLDGLMDIRDNFAYTWKFDGAFDANMNRWEALKLICRAALMKPIMAGGIIRFVDDSIAKTNVTTFFGMANIELDTWTFSREEPDPDEPDGFEGTFVDDFTWRQKTVSKTSSGGTPSNPETIDLFGITDDVQAGHVVRHMANAKIHRRNHVSFATGLEGHIPMPGDLIIVACDLPRWGQSGEVIGYDSGTFTLTVDHELTWGGGNHDIYLREPDGSAYGPVAVTKGATDAHVVLPGDPGFVPRINRNGDRTHFAFGEEDQAATKVEVTSTVPVDKDKVTINGVVYNASVYAGLPT